MMKKFFANVILISFLLCQSPFALADDLPDLPALPEFDTVIPPDGIDAFAPSGSSSPVAKPVAKPVAQTNAKPTQNTYKPVNNYTATPKQTITQPIAVSKPVNTGDNSYYKNNISSAYKLPKGKKFTVRLGQNISDKTPKGSRITFVSLYPESATYVTIPAGTTFRGTIADSHNPQLSGNGGLIVIKVDEMIYKNQAYRIDAKVSVANGKHIYFNNIKGKRMYVQSIPKAMKPGTKFFKKMWRVTCNLARNDSGVEIFLTPFSLLTGTLVYGVNFIVSPVLAIFYKGKSISIPKESMFTIKLREDVMFLK